MECGDTDHELMRRIAGGDSGAYRVLLGRYLSVSVRFAERMLASRAEAEDIVQEAFFKVWSGASAWQPRAKFSTWLYRVIFNACIDHKRKVIRFAAVDLAAVEDNAPSALEVLSQQQQAAQVREALAVLPERQRAALILSYYEGLGNQEAADILGVPLGAFQQLLFRARQGLRRHLIGEGEEQKNGSL